MIGKMESLRFEHALSYMRCNETVGGIFIVLNFKTSQVRVHKNRKSFVVFWYSNSLRASRYITLS